MFDGKSLKKTLIGSAVLLSASLLLPANAVATSCSSSISGTALSGEICTFDATNSVTVSSGAVLGGISQDGYTPASSFILNSGTITNDELGPGIGISDSSLSNGITNNGIISIGLSAGILINDSSEISGGISNSGSIISAQDMGFQLDRSILNGNFTNSGSIISNSIDNPAILFSDSTMTGDVINSGIVRADGIGSGILMRSLSMGGTLNGNVINSGTISAGGSGLYVNVMNVQGGITNSGSITGSSDDGIAITNSQLRDNITNSGAISGNDNGIRLEGSNVISGGIVNQAGATITGTTASGIYINDISPVTGNIKNYGTISGSTYGIYINIDSTSGAIDTYEGSTVNGAIDARTTVVNFYGGTINGTINVGSLNINSSSTFNMAHSITVENAVTNAGIINIGSTVRTITGDYTQSTGGLLKINAQDTSNYGHLAVTDAVNLTQSGAIDVNVTSGASIVRGNTLSNVILGNTLTTPTAGFSITDNSLLLNFTGALNDSSNGVHLLAVDDASTSISRSNSAMGNRGGAAAASKLDEIIASSPGGDWNSVISELNKFTTDRQIADAVNQTVPALVGASNSAVIETMNTALRIIQTHEQSKSGFSSGKNLQANPNLWMKTFGSWGNQGDKDGVVGYNSNSYGLITGVDKVIDSKTRLGVAASYFNSRLTSNNDYNRVNVDSFLGILYGNYNLDKKTEINTQLAAGYNRSNSNRNINFGNLNRTAKGNYDGWSLHAGSGISHSINVTNKTTITPQFRLDYFNVGNSSYNESGAGALDLRIASQSQSQLIPALEAKADHEFTQKLSLSLNGGLGYDLLHSTNTVSASFAGVGGKFITHGLEPSPWIIRSGAGLTWKQNDKVDFTMRYDRRDRGSYDNQTVSLKLRVMF